MARSFYVSLFLHIQYVVVVSSKIARHDTKYHLHVLFTFTSLKMFAIIPAVVEFQEPFFFISRFRAQNVDGLMSTLYGSLEVFLSFLGVNSFSYNLSNLPYYSYSSFFNEL